MSNLENYKNVFADVFSVDKEEVINLKYQDIDSWDSVGHMALMAAIEEKFDIFLDMDDVIDFSSFDVGKQILVKYNVNFD